MRRTDRIEDIVKRLEQEARDLKNPQRVGQDSLLSYRTNSNDQYDYYFRLYQTNPIRDFRLTFTHSIAKDGALIDLMIYARANNSDVMADPIPYRTTNAPTIYTRWRKDVPLQPDKTSWHIRMWKGQVGVSYYDAYFKFFFYGTDTGTWTITEI